MPSNKACPAPDCWAANPPQRDASTVLAENGETAEWVRSARICGYCGCVYTGHGDDRGIRGYLDNALVGKGWQPNAPGPQQ
jgi:hypothetical protein